MQQTKNYKLNLIETSDTFSPAPLNENAQKTEAALNALSAADSALHQRIVTLENCRVVVGRYLGNNGEQVIDLGERPAAVLVAYYGAYTGYVGLAVGDVVCVAYSGQAMKLVDNGFWVTQILNQGIGSGYCYIAFLGDWPKNDTVSAAP